MYGNLRNLHAASCISCLVDDDVVFVYFAVRPYV